MGEVRKLTDKELNDLPDFACTECGAIFGYEENLCEDEEVGCPYGCHNPDAIVRIADYDDQVWCLIQYAHQLEKKLEKAGNYNHSDPYGCGA